MTVDTYPATLNEQRPSSQASDALPAFGAMLATYRERRELSQSRLAARCNLNHSVISRFEMGERNPKRSTLRVIADALNITGVDRMLLFASAGQLEVVPDFDQLELIELVLSLDADGLRAVRALVTGMRLEVTG